MNKANLFWGALAVVVAFSFYKNIPKIKGYMRVFEISQTIDQPPAAPATPTPPSPTPAASSYQPDIPHQYPQPLPIPQPPPDPLAMRKMDLPMPGTIKEILDSSTDFREPEMPGLRGRYDNDMFTTYRGYYEAQPGKYRRIQLANSDSVQVIEMEEVNAKFTTYANKNADIERFNFNGDVYSYIFMLPSRKIYVKFSVNNKLEDYEQPVRMMRGWVLDASTRAMPLVMVDAIVEEMLDPKRKGAFLWPAFRTLKARMPGQLPFDR